VYVEHETEDRMAADSDLAAKLAKALDWDANHAAGAGTPEATPPPARKPAIGPPGGFTEARWNRRYTATGIQPVIPGAGDIVLTLMAGGTLLAFAFAGGLKPLLLLSFLGAAIPGFSVLYLLIYRQEVNRLRQPYRALTWVGCIGLAVVSLPAFVQALREMR
jgi:hypothetical protein